MNYTHNGQEYYDAIMAAYVDNGGVITFANRQEFARLRVALNLSAETALAIESDAKTNYRQANEERELRESETREKSLAEALRAEEDRIRNERNRIDEEERRKREEFERAAAEEARQKVEREERERKEREAREEKERAEAEARRRKEEEEARLLAERKKREARIRRVKGVLKFMAVSVIGVLPLIPAAFWLLPRIGTMPYRAYTVAGSVVFSWLLYLFVLRRKDPWWQFAYVLFAIAMIAAVFAMPKINGAIGSYTYPAWVAVSSLILFISATEWAEDNEVFFYFWSSIATVACAIILAISCHWGVAAFMALVVFGVFVMRASNENDLRMESWCWIAMGIGMLISTVFGCNGLWIPCSIGIAISICFVVKGK